jgi:hypothetical protein
MTHGRPVSKGADKRRSPRNPANFGAMIVLDSGVRVRCMVKDFSHTGALLVVPSVLGIPEEFTLEAANGLRRRVVIRRRGRSRLGVEFI